MMKVQFLTICCAVVSVLFTSQQAQAKTVTGWVVNEQGQPAADAEVAVFQDLLGGYELDRSNLLAPVAKTAADGRFEFHDVDVVIRTNTFVVVRKNGQACAWERYDQVPLVLTLEKAGSLTGMVRDEAGSVVAGAKVRALPWYCPGESLKARPLLLPLDWFVTETDEKGAFQFNSFPAGAACNLWVTGPGWHGTYKRKDKVEVGRTDIELVLPEERKVRGRVVNAKTGDAVPGVELEIHSFMRPEGPHRFCPQKGISDAAGQFTLEGVPVGMYHIEVTVPVQGTAQWAGGRVDVNVPADSDVTHIEVPVEKGGILEVKTADWATGDGIGRMWLLLFGTASRSARPWLGWGLTTDANGRARIRVPEATIGLYACRVPADVDGNLFWLDFKAASVKTGQTVQLTAEVKPAPSVKDSLCDPNGTRLEDVSVTLNPLHSNRPQIIERLYAQGWGNDMGPHHFAVLARDERRNLAAALIAADLAKPGTVRLSSGITLTGQVIDSNGRPVAEAPLGLELRRTGDTDNYCIVTTTTTGAEGHFEIPAVPIPPHGTQYWLIVKPYGYERLEQKVELPAKGHIYWRAVKDYGYQGLHQARWGDTRADQVVKWLAGREGDALDVGSVVLPSTK